MKAFVFGPKDAIAMAQFIAELTKQNINYSVESIIGGWRIHIKGD